MGCRHSHLMIASWTSRPRRPTSTVATSTANPNPTTGRMATTTYMPTMKRSPWARLMTPINPNVIHKPSARRIRIDVTLRASNASWR